MSNNEIASVIEEEILNANGANEACADDELNDRKPEFVAAITGWQHSTTNLCDTIASIVDECGDDSNTAEIAATLLSWAVEAGVPEKSAREIISRVLVGKGKRRRKSGAGRKSTLDADKLAALLAFATDNFGEEAAKALRSAAALAKAEAA